MELLKTKAFVEDAKHLRLLKNELEFLEKGTEVELAIFIKNNKGKKNWKEVLNEIGTYNEKELSNFNESRKDFNSWQPREY